ncbi:DUF6153 family protein [Lentzea sp. BCCO 10_0856]|uniref:DUF6153 family protein n=1 Tax=Lentzea miocenica TaxID=3095431 RepID=A0ABU4TGP3_9PSEU|nr:DUF6153 family protein [Lentzea sp. BCCO 10_0856]MDX8037225.1 DUF6153 family protein [Lentzea sp. BCCO 10_0856]
MNGTTRTAHGARGHLSRLVVVLAVLAGLALVVGVQCTDGMSMAHGGHETAVEHPVAAGMLMASDLETPGGSDTGGALAACLMFIVAVIAIVAGLKLPGSRSSAATSRSVRMTLGAVALPRAPSLARLCLLRI